MQTQFVTLEIPLGSTAVALRQTIEMELRQFGEPLRWALTTVDAVQQTARVEAVVTTSGEV